MSERYFVGGLMRCCTTTLHRRWAEQDTWQNGDTIDCDYCTERTVRTDGIWRWDHP